MADARQSLRSRRLHLARVAGRLGAGAPVAAATLSWEALQAAPDWLGWPDDALALWLRRVGAVFCAPALRRWIDTPRVQALRAAVGDGWYRALLTSEDAVRSAALPAGLPDWPRHGAEADTVAPLLRSCGAAVLVCTLPHGGLRHAVSQALAPLAELMMPAAHAQALARQAAALCGALAVIEEERAA